MYVFVCARAVAPACGVCVLILLLYHLCVSVIDSSVNLQAVMIYETRQPSTYLLPTLSSEKNEQLGILFTYRMFFVLKPADNLYT